MFKSNARSSNFAQAGKAAADETVRAFAAARRNSTNFGELAQKAATLRSGEKIAAMKAAQHVTKAGINAAASVKENELRIEGQQALRKGKRKAGALAAGGKLIASAGEYLNEPRKKRTVGSEDSYFDTQIDKAKAKANELREKANNVDLTGGFKPMDIPNLNESNNSSSTPSNTSTNSTSGKAQALGSGTGGSKYTFTPEQVKAFDITGLYESDSSGGYNAFNTGGSAGGTIAHGSGDSSKTNTFGMPLTSMTIGQVKNLQAQGKLHAAGRFQFIGNSLPEAAQFAGLSDTDSFSPENQNRMFLAFGNKYGTGRWVGLDKASPEERNTVQSAFNNWQS